MAYGSSAYGEAPYAGESDSVRETTASFTGSGVLSVVAFAVFATTAPFSGSGVLSVTTETSGGTVETTADFTGSGALSVTAVGVGVTTAPFTGSGVLSVATVEVEQTSAPFTGGGVLSVDAFDASAPSTTADFTGSGVLSVVTEYFEWPTTDTSDRDDGIDLDGTGLVTWNPAVVTTPARYVPDLWPRDTARAGELVSIGPAGQPKVTWQSASIPKTRDRVLLGGIDITYWRGVQTPTPDFALGKPLLWHSGSMTLPQLNPQWERLGDAATDPVAQRCKTGTSVVVQRVDLAGDVVATDYVGFIDSIDANGTVLSFVLAGHGIGRVQAQNWVPNPIFRKRNDLAFQALSFLRQNRCRTTHGTTIGIPMVQRGGTDGLTHINDLSSFMVNRDGDQWDIMPDEDTRIYDVVPTDRTTVDFTFYLDDNLITQQLSEAGSEQVDEVYVTARTSKGELIAFIDLPGLSQGDAPPFPGHLELGDSGDNVELVNAQLELMDLLDYDDTSTDARQQYTQDTADGVEDVQRRGGLTVTGEVNEATWNMLWNLQATGGFSVDKARQRPAIVKPWVDQWLRMPNGGKKARNPEYDFHRIPHSIMKDLGTGHNQHGSMGYGKTFLTPDDQSNWQGTVTFVGGVIVGDWNPGDPLTADMVRSPRWIRPGMNGKAANFDGGTVLHVSGTNRRGGTPEQVEAVMSTLGGDTMSRVEAINRDRETRASVSRSPYGGTRASSVHNDVTTDWTRKAGRLANPTNLVAGWNEVIIPAGQEGVVKSIHTRLEDPDEYAMALCSSRLGVRMLNHRAASPLADPGSSPRWYERDAFANWFDRRGGLDTWGQHDQPCGYGFALKSSGGIISGEFKEVAGFNYTAAKPGRLYLYIWVASANTLLPGRILTQQLTSPV